MTEEPPMKREHLGLLFSHHWTVVRRIGCPPKHWPMSFAGIFLTGMLAADPVGVLVVAPTNSTVRLVYTNVQSVVVVVPTNVTVNVITNDKHPPIPPFTVKTNLCDIPVTLVTSSSIDNPGGPNLTITHNRVFRRQPVQNSKP